MNFKSVLMLVTGCLLMMCGCKDEKPQFGASMNIRILGVTGKSNLTPGLKLGLYAGEPVGAENVLFTVADNSMVQSETDLKWAFDQSQSSRFFVYAPYKEEYTGKETVEITIPTDQTTKEKLLNCNYLLGLASGAPNQGAVTIKLQHAMTAMIVSFDNRSGDKIESIDITGFQTKAKLNTVTGTLTVAGERGVIKPYRIADDENTFMFLYVPQDATPVFNLKMSSGKSIAYTFDNSCHEYPGRIIKMTGIRIEEKTTDANILSLSGLNLTQWTSNGLPESAVIYPYVDLAGIGKVDTDEGNYNFFEAYLKKVTITSVDRTDPEVYGVILEDESKAIHVWTYPNENLDKFKVGATITGRVLGYMEKPSGDEFKITYLYTYYSTFGKSDTLPKTEGTFGALASKIGDWEYRRMEFKDVTVKRAFNGDMAVFTQGEDSAFVICPGIAERLTNGTKGNLIGFPVHTGTDIQIMVDDPGQFESFEREYTDGEYAAFTSDSTYGFYDLTNPETVANYMNAPDAEFQYSFGFDEMGCVNQFTDTRNGSSLYLYVYNCPDSPVPGHEYPVHYAVWGNLEMEGKTIMMECIKKDDNTAWLVDRVGKKGLRLAL